MTETAKETAKPKTREASSKERQSRLDGELADTFPASDPPSVTQPGTTAGAPDHKRAKAR